MAVIERLKVIQSAIAVEADIADSDEIRLESVASAIYVPAALSVLEFYGSDSVDDDGTFTVLRRRTNADTDFSTFENVTIDTGGTEGWYPLPDECLPFRRIKIKDAGDPAAAAGQVVKIAGAT